jgi:hypothetical protein
MTAKIIDLARYRAYAPPAVFSKGDMVTYKGALAQVVTVGKDGWYEITVWHTSGMFTCWAPAFRLHRSDTIDTRALGAPCDSEPA